MSELSRLIKKRGTEKAGLTIFSNFLDKITEKTDLNRVDVIRLRERL